MTSGADLVTGYLVAQADGIDGAGRAVADGDPEGVHDLRVACRRARSTLRAHRRLLRQRERPMAQALVDDLRQLGLDLSERRDEEVGRELVRGWADEDGWPPESLRAVLDALGGAPARPAAGAAVAVRAHGQATALLMWTDLAGWRSRATADAAEALAPVAALAGARLERWYSAAVSAPDDDAGAAWHEVRKATKRVRYVAEVARPVVRPASEVVSTAKTLQTVLGDRQDAQVVLERLRTGQGPPSAPLLLGAERARRALREAQDAAPGAYEALRRAQS